MYANATMMFLFVQVACHLILGWSTTKQTMPEWKNLFMAFLSKVFYIKNIYEKKIKHKKGTNFIILISEAHQAIT